MPLRTSLTLLAALPLAAIALAGCGGGAATSPPKTSDGQAATLGVAHTDLGNVLVNKGARTLYLFQRDSGTTSECTGPCAANWPPLKANGTPLVGTGAKRADVATSVRADGSRQITYNGHPLYTFVNDEKPGDTKGEGINAFGGSWFAVSAAGNKVLPKSQPSGGYAY